MNHTLKAFLVGSLIVFATSTTSAQTALTQRVLAEEARQREIERAPQEKIWREQEERRQAAQAAQVAKEAQQKREHHQHYLRHELLKTLVVKQNFQIYLSRRVCELKSERKSWMENIATQKRAIKIGGVIDLAAMNTAATTIVYIEDQTSELLTRMKAEKIAPLKCDSDPILQANEENEQVVDYREHPTVSPFTFPGQLNIDAHNYLFQGGIDAHEKELRDEMPQAEEDWCDEVAKNISEYLRKPY
jgi:hypothetical protein